VSTSNEPAVMSVEQPLWRALTGLRLLTLAYALFRFATSFEEFRHPVGGWAYMAVLTAWSVATLPRLGSARRCTKGFLGADLTVAVAGIVLTRFLDDPHQVSGGHVTMPTVWAASSVLAFAIKGGWRWGASASTVVGLADVAERGRFTEQNVHNIVLLFISSAAVGYVVELARASERTLARALRIEAATRERERLARDIHDGVLQVLAMVQRRGAEIGGEAAELGRMAGEQEVALRMLMTSAPDGAEAAVHPDASVPATPTDGGPIDLRTLLTPFAGPDVTVSAPATPVLLAAHAAAEVAAAVAAALDNVARHAGPGARAWILLEEEPDAVLVSVRDDGPGFPPERLADAEREGRLGVSQSIRGRLRDLGGSAGLVSVAGQGVEVEMRLPRAPHGTGGPGGPGDAGDMRGDTVGNAPGRGRAAQRQG
jgi:signal transduction histidine kinase